VGTKKQRGRGAWHKSSARGAPQKNADRFTDRRFSFSVLTTQTTLSQVRQEFHSRLQATGMRIACFVV
jgi:hypothetical protein